MQIRIFKRIILYIALAIIFVLVGCNITNEPSSSEDKKDDEQKEEIITNKYKVTFVFDNGCENQVTEVEEGKKVAKPLDPTKQGYTFDGWYNSYDEKWVFGGYNITEDVTLTAKWNINQYTITIKNYYKDEDLIIKQDYNSMIKIDDPTKEGYIFKEWSIDLPSQMPDKDLTIEPVWTLCDYKITYFLDDGVLSSEGITDYTIESYIESLPVPIKDYYIFKNWTDKNGNIINEIKKGTTGDIELYANYEENSVLLTNAQISFSYEIDGLEINKPYELKIKIKNNDIDYQLSDFKYTLSFSKSSSGFDIDENGTLTPLKKGDGELSITLTIGRMTFTEVLNLRFCKTEGEEKIDLNGYTIKLAQAESVLGYYDVNLTKDTEDKYSYYDKEDRIYKQQAWEEIEEKYNCKIQVVAYPSDAPWGPARWSYILDKANSKTSEYDFYVLPTSQISDLASQDAILNISNFYQENGENYMDSIGLDSVSYNNQLYGFVDEESNIYNMMGYNVGLWEKIHEADPSIVEPAQMYLDNNWNYNTFKDYCIKVQNVLNSLYGVSDEHYYCISGYGIYYWIGMVNAAGTRILDKTNLKSNLSGNNEELAAQTLKELYECGCIDPAFQVDEGVATWNASHSLFNTGDMWFVNSANRWAQTLWGEETKYGYVPFPTSPNSSNTYVGTIVDSCIAMSNGRDWAYQGFGDDCTRENIFSIIMEYYNSAKEYYQNNPSYSIEEKLANYAKGKFSSEASVNAYVKMMLGTKGNDGNYQGGIKEYGFFEPYVSNSNPIVGSYGAAGTLAGDINAYIKNNNETWLETVGDYQRIVDKRMIEEYGNNKSTNTQNENINNDFKIIFDNLDNQMLLLETISQDITLPTTYTLVNKTISIEWNCDHEGIISTTGVYTKPDKDTYCTLTAIITMVDENSNTYYGKTIYKVLVKGDSPEDVIEYFVSKKYCPSDNYVTTSSSVTVLAYDSSKKYKGLTVEWGATGDNADKVIFKQANKAIFLAKGEFTLVGTFYYNKQVLTTYCKSQDTILDLSKSYYTFDSASQVYVKVDCPVLKNLGSYYEMIETITYDWMKTIEIHVTRN